MALPGTHVVARTAVPKTSHFSLPDFSPVALTESETVIVSVALRYIHCPVSERFPPVTSLTP